MRRRNAEGVHGVMRRCPRRSSRRRLAHQVAVPFDAAGARREHQLANGAGKLPLLEACSPPSARAGSSARPTLISVARSPITVGPAAHVKLAFLRSMSAQWSPRSSLARSPVKTAVTNKARMRPARRQQPPNLVWRRDIDADLEPLTAFVAGLDLTGRRRSGRRCRGAEHHRGAPSTR